MAFLYTVIRGINKIKLRNERRKNNDNFKRNVKHRFRPTEEFDSGIDLPVAGDTHSYYLLALHGLRLYQL